MLNTRQQQTFLKHYYAYYKGDIDGISGSGTKRGITLFQSNHGLSADGIWGENTNAKAVEIATKIQEALNDNIKVSSVISDKIKALLESEKVNDDKINNIYEYAKKELNENGDKLDVDGIIGEATINAIKNFQAAHNLSVDGVVGLNTALELWGKELITPVKVKDWNLYPNFTKDEFKCQCGGAYCNGYPDEIDTALVEMLQAIRNKYNKPLIITSGVRCKQHNYNVGGVGNSRHINGKAADFYVPGVSGATLRALCYELGCRYSYVIVGDTIHADVY